MLGACQPHLQTREKAERAATGRTGKPQGQEAADLGDHSLPLEVEVPPRVGIPACSLFPLPLGGICEDSTPSIIRWLVILGQGASARPLLVTGVSFIHLTIKPFSVY